MRRSKLVLLVAITFFGGWSASALAGDPAVHFEHDVLPILGRFGCNSGGCHGKAEGQGGFKLSVFGFDPDADRAAIVQEGRGRRIAPSHPEASLILAKASGGVPHGGGVRIRRDSASYRVLRDWIAGGGLPGDPEAPRVAAIDVSPSHRVLAPNADQRLRVVATYTDGRTVDVTGLSTFRTNDEGLATVDETGRVTAGRRPGDVAIMAGYAGRVAVFRALLPRPGDPPPNEAPVLNFVDEHVDRKLRELNVAPSGVCDDAAFVRRIHLDVVGRLPTPDEVRAFLADNDADKHARLVDALLERPEYADLQSLAWADLLKVDRLVLGHEGASSLYRWIHGSFARNQPFDEFARDLLTAEGPLADVPAAWFHRTGKTPGDAASHVAQAFLGVRIECAQCHHHPYDVWSQTDYQGMVGFFVGVGTKRSARGEVLGAFSGGSAKHPRTKAIVHAHPLGTAPPADELPGDRRRVLAEWMTSPENPWFARAFVNRTWARMTGRGLVEPVDDFRPTNPPTNPELLDALAADFAAHDFDVKHLIRTIAASRTYQLSSTPNATNAEDDRNHSRAPLKRLPAEVLFDAVCDATGVPEKFEGVPSGTRAVQLWDSQVKHDFLRLFGRPVRATACSCERSSAPSVGQVLHTLNSPAIQSRLSHVGGTIARLERRLSSDDALTEELYLTFFSRRPTDAERAAVAKYLSTRPDRRRAAEDVAWSMLNSVEFAFAR